ncbi:MAG: hypothetical protein VX473_00065 [Candidatus Thermoplasmatota archaeon]|nr:hypothetical protein [Candidatus Thermoplasmatota archaeon]
MRSYDTGGNWSTDDVHHDREIEGHHTLEEGFFDSIEGSMPISSAIAHGFHFLAMMIIMITVSVILLSFGIAAFLNSLNPNASDEFFAFGFIFTSCGFSTLLATIFGASVKMISDGVSSGINNSIISEK